MNRRRWDVLRRIARKSRERISFPAHSASPEPEIRVIIQQELAPFDPSPQRYHHNRTGEDNADAHHKRQIMGREVVVAITDGKLHLGPWEHIFYYEFDGRRKKRILVKIIGE